MDFEVRFHYVEHNWKLHGRNAGPICNKSLVRAVRMHKCFSRKHQPALPNPSSYPIHRLRFLFLSRSTSSLFRNPPSTPGIGVNTTGASGVVAVAIGIGAGLNSGTPAFGSTPGPTSAGVGKPTGIMMVLSTPLTVMTMEVLDRVGREQYPISTQLRPSLPRTGGVYVLLGFAVGAGAREVPLLAPLGPPQSCSVGFVQARLLRYQQNMAALFRQPHNEALSSPGLHDGASHSQACKLPSAASAETTTKMSDKRNNESLIVC